MVMFARLLLLLVALVVASAPSADRLQAQPAPAADTAGLKALARESLAQLTGEIGAAGLSEPVEILRDRWGVTHIYARNVDDLFFAQGYVMGQDRLWQLEMWRRGREGRLAEILGPAAFERDRDARLLRYRGPFDDREWTSYHPEGRRILTAFAKGLNACIAASAGRLPVEFRLTGVVPEPWSPETLLARQAAFGDASAELQLALDVARYGAAEANRRRAPDPWDELAVPEGLDVGAIAPEVIARLRGAQGPLPKPAVVESYRRLVAAAAANADGPGVQVEARGSRAAVAFDPTDPPGQPGELLIEPGSNNWVVAGPRSVTGKPMVVNDPHREVTNPSLRYVVHLNAPGWNVIGAVEPPFVGVAIGHNERLGWGLTIVGTDQQDVYVEETRPDRPNEVRWNGNWEPMRVVREEIRIRGEATRTVELKYTRHGPVFFEDTARRRAYALRTALGAPGTAPYLAGLRLSQARDCLEFLDAALFWKAPSENLICGDVDGNISWQASALTPRRAGWSGRLPVPGGGKHEWAGFRTDLPREINPARGYIATANHNIHPPGYAPPIMFKSSRTLPFDRITRLLQLFESPRALAIADHQRVQHDAYSLRAAADLQMFRGWMSPRADIERARALLAAWDAVLDKDSAAAAVYTVWRTTRGESGEAAGAAAADRSRLETELAAAIAKLTADQGPDWSAWRYGRLHGSVFPHPVATAFDLPRIERSGGAGSVAADGATYREILDVADWDRSVITNVPGQSGQPESPFYGNLLPLYARQEYFPLLFSRAAIEREAAHRLALKPAARSTEARSGGPP
jgi:penicillin amidase